MSIYVFYFNDKLVLFFAGTEDIYYKADATLISKYGKEYTWDLRMKVLGCTEQMSVHKIVTELKLPISEEKYRTEVKELLRKMLPQATLMPGICRS